MALYWTSMYKQKIFCRKQKKRKKKNQTNLESDLFGDEISINLWNGIAEIKSDKCKIAMLIDTLKIIP